MTGSMRDIFDDLYARDPVDPAEAARRTMRPNLPRRFYQAATVGEGEGGFRLLLDGRPARTPARRPLALPSRGLADAVAAEWNAQAEVIDPARMPLTRLANAIADGVVAEPAPVAAEIVKYLGSDLLFYRAGGPERLVARQAEAWDPLIAWAREALGARFVLAEGVVFVAQPEGAVAAAAAAVPADPWRLGAVHAVMTLTGSALIALALAAGRIDAATAWAAAHVDEDWNMELWGRDEIALARRAARWEEMQAAAAVLRHVG